MSAAQALKAARAAGIDLRLDHDDLLLQAPAPPPIALLDLLSRHKSEIVALLRSGQDELTGQDWRAFFDNRVSVAEFKSGLPRPAAEDRAFDCCVAEWLNRNPQHSAPEGCFQCAQPETAHDLLLPFGIGSRGQVWLHSRCCDAWYSTRMAQAISALAALGITPPTKFPNDFGKNGGA